ncbi:MAG: HlyC/CorC family transporter [Treponema sp.]|nr:HlyC/CorC family transporter [Candidatus Treponema caballi]
MLFSAAESAFLSVNKLRVRFLRQKGDRRAIRVGKLLDNKEQLINTILAGNTLVNIGLSAILTSIAMDLFGNAGIAAATFVATILLLIFGEIAPKSIASRYPDKIAFALSGYAMFFRTILLPFVSVFTKFVFLLARIAGVKPEKKAATFTEEDIKTFMEVGEEEGVLAEDEKTMMHKVFSFTDLEAKDIMQPRTTWKAVPINANYRTVIELSQKTSYSRFPVFDNDIDDIKGILYMKDVLDYADKPREFEVRKIMRPALFIPETQKMSSIQEALRANNQSIAIILDEYSQTAGLLTIEDITRELFGTVSDEFSARQMQELIQVNELYHIADGAIRIEDLCARLGIDISSTESDTLAGWMLEQLGRIPEKGAVVALPGLVFIVKNMEGRRISKVIIKKETT